MATELRSTFVDTAMVLTLHNTEYRNTLAPEMYVAGVETLERCRIESQSLQPLSSQARAMYLVQAATLSDRKLIDNVLPRFNLKASKACVHGLKPYGLFQNQFWRPLKTWPQPLGFH